MGVGTNKLFAFLLAWLVRLEMSLGQTLKVGVMLDKSLQSDITRHLKDGQDLAAAHNVYWNVTFNIYYIKNGLVCDGITGIRGALDLITNSSFDAMFGSSCHENCLGTAQIMDYFNIPYLPLTCQNPALDDQNVYQAVIRIFGSLSAFGWSMKAMFADSKWKSTAIISESGSYLCKNTIDSIQQRFRESSIKVSEFIQMSSSVKPEELQSIGKIRSSARVVIVCHTNYTSLQEIFFTAQDLGMTDPATYAWLTIYNLYSEFPYRMLFTPWITDGKMSKEQIEKRKEAFYSLKILTFKNFTSLSNVRGFFNGSFPIRVSYLTEVAYLYLILREKVLAIGQDPRNGRVMVNASKSVEFDGRYEKLKFNNDGYRMMTVIVWSLTPGWDSFEPMYELQPIALNNYTPILVGNYSWGKKLYPPPDFPSCGFLNELCSIGDGSNSLTLPLIAAFVIAVILIVSGFTVGLIQNKRRSLRMEWRIDQNELEFLKDEINTSKGSKLISDSKTEGTTDQSKELPNDTPNYRGLFSDVTALYKGMMVTVKSFSKKGIKYSNNIFKELAELKEIQHDNLVSFIGAYFDADSITLVLRHCARGSLQNIIADSDVKLDVSFKMSFIQDIVKGMAYLHKSSINYHGRLTSGFCMVTNRWVVKVTGFGLSETRNHNPPELSEDELYKSQLWTAPEHLRSKVANEGSQKGDVYSFAIVAYEVLFGVFPYQSYNLTYKEIIARVMDSGYIIFRPSIVAMDKTGIDQEVLNLVNRCWDENPASRPSFDEINKKNRKENKDIIDSILDKLEKYANNLEEVVQERTDKLIEEKRKTDMLLHSLLPPNVAEELKAGRQVEPRLYQMVTIYFSDIVGFTTLSSQSTPMEIVDLLNDLYGFFDDTIAKHNVYKVETIGDAYMVVGGLPQETDRHAVEICNMSLDLLSIVQTFKIRHRPEMMLMLRIGIHSGPCAAGVVGHTMPRYCLFGDTVTTASRMESTGKALKIHLSSAARDELVKYPGYVLELRGETDLKGSGTMTTYWLIKKEIEAANNKLMSHAL